MSLIARFIVFACLLLPACAGKDPANPPGAANSIVITRQDGSTVAVAPAVWAWCGAWEPDVVSAPTVHVLAGSAAASWELRAVRSDVRIGEPLAFPNTFIWNQPRGADMFVRDPPNELSSQELDSSGSVVFEQLDCSANGGIRVRVNAVLGSEYGNLPPVTVTGSFASPWTGRPGP